MVGEFPELQGIMGGYYAATTARARGRAGDRRITTSRASPATRCRAIRRGWWSRSADKLETLVGMFGIGQVPTATRTRSHCAATRSVLDPACW
jgi:glycyl-tRNA synthetase beta chain